VNYFVIPAKAGIQTKKEFSPPSGGNTGSPGLIPMSASAIGARPSLPDGRQG